MAQLFTVPRNLSLQEEFYRLESRLQTAYIMLLTAMGVQDQVRRYASTAECAPSTRLLSRLCMGAGLVLMACHQFLMACISS
jgi:hypothetical protein